jgi:PAS domain S-box-containing protein
MPRSLESRTLRGRDAPALTPCQPATMPIDTSRSKLFSLSPNAYMVLTPDWVFTDANEAYLRVTGRTLDQLVGRKLFDAFPGDPKDPSTQQLIDSLEQVGRERKPHHIALIRYAIAREIDGQQVLEERFWSASHLPVLNDDGDLVAILQHTVDVTELQRLKQTLRATDPVRANEIEGGVFARAQAVEARHALLDAERRNLRKLFDQAPGFLAVLKGPLHQYVLVNQAYRKLIGEREVIGKNVREALPEITGQGYFELFDRVYATGEPFVGRGMRVVLQVEAGKPPAERYVDFVFQPVTEVDGSISGILIQGHDITDQQVAEQKMADYRAQLEALLSERTALLTRTQAEHAQTQAQLEHVQKLESLGRLTGGIAHDFNNLLQVMSNSLLLLKRAVADQPNAQRWIETATNAVGSGAKLTGQLLAFARRQPLEPRTLNVGAQVKGMDDLLRRALGGAIEVETVIAGGLWNTHADPAQLENALLNLAINARDAMEGQGRLTIEASNAMLDADYTSGQQDLKAGQYVLIAVSDTGCGMPPEVIEKAFEPFFSTKAPSKGTGLGLSMVYGFVKQSGGHVKIYSEVGEGSTVKIYLPRSHQAEDRPEVRLAGPVQGGTETILVVEDDPAVLATTVETLTELGYRVLKATEAQSALAIVQSGVPIDLLFTDVVMPGPLRSPELARLARAALPDLQVIFTSGYTENAIVHGGRLDPGVNLLSKPYRREDLARRIRQVLQDAPPRKGARVAARAAQPVRVLFVEDDADLRRVGEELLQTLGHSVEAVASGEEALGALLAQPFDVLLADVGLPGLSGHELARAARAQSAALKIVLASGFGRMELPAMDQAVDRTLLLPKPYSLEGLRDALDRVQAL